MTDRLTPRERFGLLVIDEPQDRIPVFPIVTSHAAAVAGVKLSDYCTDGRQMARSQILAQERYGHDFISIFSEVGIVAEALGAQFVYPDDDLPKLKQTRFPDLASLPALTLEQERLPDARTAGRYRVYYEALELAYQSVGDRLPILAFVPAPFTTAMHLVPTEELLLGLSDTPESVHGLLEYATQATIEFLGEILAHCGLPMIVDPLASSSVISPKAYRDFALPCERRLIDYLHRFDLDVTLHICGDTMPILGLLEQSNADLISLDRVDVARAKAILGAKLRLIGNFETTELLFGKPGEIEAGVRQMTELGRDNPKGYVAATGCEVPIRAPSTNVAAFIRGALGR